jgi:SAM-dependent methyltransferase
MSQRPLTRLLDIGCGPIPRNFFSADEVYGIDVAPMASSFIATVDLAVEPIPFGDSEFEFVTAFDFIEHVPRVLYVPHRRNAFVELMNEIYRVLKPDGRFYSHTPAYPHGAAFRDPTHVNIITEETFPIYFDDRHRLASVYGFKGSFKILEQKWHGPHLASLLIKV